ncbi:alpha/beta fold hydrolase [Halorubellus salinus]|uniref:alpha/beta fold hydrolase n=1 Tax=Halorubellus salinus TaxID=755309 RepID=UPI001D06A520
MLDHASAFGDQRDPTVVLLPPAGATRYAWTPHARQLAADDHHVVAVDLPGHGTHPDPSFAFESAVADVGAVLQATERGVVAGHSLGGYVALHAAVAHQQRVDGLVLAGAATDFRSVPGLAVSAVSTALSPVIDAIGHSERATNWLDDLTGDVRDDQRPPDDVDTHNPATALADGMRASAFQDTWPIVETYDGPTRIVHGTDEAFESHARELAERVDADLVRIDGDHRTPIQHPDAFTDVLADFAGDVAIAPLAPE